MVSGGGSDRSGESGHKITPQALQALASLRRASIEEDDPRRMVPLPKQAKAKLIRQAINEAEEKYVQAHQHRQEKREKRRKRVKQTPLPPKPKRISARTVKDKFRELYSESFPDSVLPMFPIKDMTLAKKMIEYYGAEAVLEALEFFFKHWREYKGTWYQGEEPTMGVFWGLKDRVFNDTKRSCVAKAANQAQVGEYSNHGEEHDPDEDIVGWD